MTTKLDVLPVPFPQVTWGGASLHTYWHQSRMDGRRQTNWYSTSLLPSSGGSLPEGEADLKWGESERVNWSHTWARKVSVSWTSTLPACRKTVWVNLSLLSGYWEAESLTGYVNIYTHPSLVLHLNKGTGRLRLNRIQGFLTKSVQCTVTHYSKNQENHSWMGNNSEYYLTKIWKLPW